MTDSPESILEKHAIKPPEICDRCFTKSMAKSSRSGAVSSRTPCSEDECGKIDIKMESGPQSMHVLKPRAKNLERLLDENGFSLDSDVFHDAVEYYASSKPPRQVFINAIAFGLGQRDPSEIDSGIDDSRTQNTTPSMGRVRPEDRDPLTKLVNGPITASTKNKLDSPETYEPYLSVFPVIMEHTEDIYYLTNADQFADEQDVYQVGSHDPPTVVAKALDANWEKLTNASSSTIHKWVVRADEEFSQHILMEALKQGVSTSTWMMMEMERQKKGSFQTTSFWSLIKRPISQPILGKMRRQKDTWLTTEEITELADQDEEIVLRILNIHVEKGTVQYLQGEWKYIGN